MTEELEERPITTRIIESLGTVISCDLTCVASVAPARKSIVQYRLERLFATTPINLSGGLLVSVCVVTHCRAIGIGAIGSIWVDNRGPQPVAETIAIPAIRVTLNR